MKYTGNHKLKKPENNDNYDIENENYNMDIIDKGISPFFVAALDSTNVYKITTGNEITELNDGFSVRVAIPSASIGSTSLIVDEVSAMPIKKVNGNSVTNLKANGVYSLTYYNGNFILASGGGEEDGTTVTSDKVLSGTTFVGQDGEIVTGSMINQGSKTAALSCGGSYTIPEGYHNGSGKVTANNLASQTPATATAGQILSGQTAWVNGNKIIGNIPQRTGHQLAEQTAYWNIGVGGNSQPQAFLKPPLGYYYGDSWIRQEVPDLRPENIVFGKNILGCIGNATMQSLGGLRLKIGNCTVTRKGDDIIINDIGFKPRFLMIRWHKEQHIQGMIYYLEGEGEYQFTTLAFKAVGEGKAWSGGSLQNITESRVRVVTVSAILPSGLDSIDAKYYAIG